MLCHIIFIIRKCYIKLKYHTSANETKIFLFPNFILVVVVVVVVVIVIIIIIIIITIIIQTWGSNFTS